MSLDILKCKIVSPELATQSYKVEDNKYLKQIQPKGFINVSEERIGRNCLSKKWHRKWEKEHFSAYDNIEEMENAVLEINKMIVVYPNELDEKIFKYLYADSSNFFEREKLNDFDFLYISW